MRTRLLFAILLTAPALAACSAQETTTVSAYTVDDPAPSAIDNTCSRMADTGDMYRYCMQYGPQQALAAER